MAVALPARDREAVLEVQDGCEALRALQREHVVGDAQAVSGDAVPLGVEPVGRTELHPLPLQARLELGLQDGSPPAAR